MACRATPTTIWSTFEVTSNVRISTDITSTIATAEPTITSVPISVIPCRDQDDGGLVDDVLNANRPGKQCQPETIFSQSAILGDPEVRIIHSFSNGPSVFLTSTPVSVIPGQCSSTAESSTRTIETVSSATSTSVSISLSPTGPSFSTSPSTLTSAVETLSSESSSSLPPQTSSSESSSSSPVEQEDQEGSTAPAEPSDNVSMIVIGTSTSFRTLTRTSAGHSATRALSSNGAAKKETGESDSNVGVILGATLGGVAGIFMILLIARYLYRLCSNKQTGDDDDFFDENPKHHNLPGEDSNMEDVIPVAIHRRSNSDSSMKKDSFSVHSHSPPMREIQRGARFLTPEPADGHTTGNYIQKRESIYMPKRRPPMPPEHTFQSVPQNQPVLYYQEALPVLAHQASWSGSSGHSGQSNEANNGLTISHARPPSSVFSNSRDPLNALKLPSHHGTANPYGPQDNDVDDDDAPLRVVNDR